MADSTKARVTILWGWPTQTWGVPTLPEMEMIEATCWFLAGQIVARFRRNLVG